MKLGLTVLFHRDETPMSYVSRLAARNGVKARRLCIDFRMRFQDVVNGDPQTLESFAELGGIDPEPLLANAFTKTVRVGWTHQGQEFHRDALSHRRIAICPCCALADIEASPKLRPHIAIYGRTAWSIDVIRTCPIHRTPLIYASEDLSWLNLHDFTSHIADFVPNLIEAATMAPWQEPSALETYVLARLGGKTSSPLLDPMPLSAALRLCEAAGAAAMSPDVDLKQLSHGDRHMMAREGYEAIAAGAGAFLAMLDLLKGTVGPRDRLDGPHVAFGKLYSLLVATLEEPGFDAVRDITRDYILENFAIAAGRDVLGKRVERRRLHSLHTLALDFSVHPKRLRKHLRAAGIVTAVQMKMSDHNIRIDAENAVEIARQLSGTLSLMGAKEHLNATRPQMDVLIKSGFVKPQRQVASFGAQARYAIIDLDDFLARLGGQLRQGEAYQAKLRNIPNAARAACCSAAEVVKLILDGKLTTTKSTWVRGYMGILVDPKAVVIAVRGPEIDGMSLREAARAIATSDGVLDALIAQGHIASFTGVNPVNRCPQTLVAPKVIKKFSAKYVSLSILPKKHGVHIATMKRRLDLAGIEPAFDPVRVGARFYLARQLSNFC
jgi:hypothetical protein